MTVYHPSVGDAYAQVGCPGSVGVLSGFSSQQLAISEIGVYFADDSFGQGTMPNTPPEKVKGEPWMFILHDVMQYESSLDGAKSRISNANQFTLLSHLPLPQNNLSRNKRDPCAQSSYQLKCLKQKRR